MLRKILNLIKVTGMMWVCILLPVLIGFSSIKSASESDVRKYMDSYLDSEATNLSKYISLQLKNSGKEISEISDAVILTHGEDSSALDRIFAEVLKDNSNIVSVNMYNSQGMLLRKSKESNAADILDINDFAIADLKDKDITFSFRQNEEDGAVLVDFVLKRTKVGDVEPFYLSVVMKWSQYETFLDRLQDGVFARKFYIISPDCKRYLSLNSLPHGEESNRNLIALGLHISDKIKDIAIGSSDVNLEDLKYRVFKSEIRSPEKMDGSQLFIVAVTDDEAFSTLVKGIFRNTPTTIVILLCIWLFICLVVAQFYNHTKEQLQISNAISDSTPSAIIVFDAETGRIQKINPSGLTLARLTPDKVPTVNAWDLFTSDKDRGYVMNAVKTNINITNYEVLVQSYSGNTFWSICSANPLEMNMGVEVRTYVVLSLMDINKRKEIEKKLANNAELLEKQVAERTADLEIKAKELEESNKELDQAKHQADAANAAKTRFLTSMSIELKTPINAIIGYSEILQEEAFDRKDTVSADDLSKIIGSAKHLLSLINEILDLSSIESGKVQLFFETVSIETLMKEIEGVSMPLITKNENSFFNEFPRDIGEMFIDQTKLRQCILNVIDNAAKFTEFGKITLRASSIIKGDEEFIEFSVADTGCGISQDKVDTIFESFGDHDNKNSSTGLGLSITKKYVECMGGTISVESELGIGSKFIIRLPRICKVESSEFVEVKNHKESESEEVFEDQVAEVVETQNKEDTSQSEDYSSLTV
ncbi:MAG: PAS domain S-box protein [Alphaproteobacteria bacterium]|nr:PAS domain S-box protein [Alphaproteobacteria bacterium]